MKFKSLVTTILILSSCVLKAQNKAEDIIGNWLTTGKEPAKIQIYKSGEKFYGKIIWLKKPTDKGKEKVDNNNPNLANRNNPIIGLVILTSFKFNGDDKWEDGEIYDPSSGETYSSNLYLKDRNTLKVRGYVGISVFGRTETWLRTD